MRANGLEIQNLGSTPHFFTSYHHDISKVVIMSKDNHSCPVHIKVGCE